ncbi:MAG: type III pantothenate kinase [Pseudomonadota bacterium]|nr:type III pantothenate kinase [Pseudomonadota bacterium]
MLLVVDVGNTNTVLGVFDESRLAHQWRISTLPRTADEFGLLLVQLLAHHRIAATDIHGVAVCTVVPAALRAIEGGVRRYLDRTARVLDHTSVLGFPIHIDNPRELGPDRVVNAVAALARCAPPLLLIDFGTATTFDCIDATGAYVGGAIAPGVQVSADALVARTARLPRVDIQRPARAIGSNTVAAMQSGAFWGYVGLVDGLARRCKDELGGNVRCIATGGLSTVVGPACAEVDEVDENLTLDGLRLWFEQGAP